MIGGDMMWLVFLIPGVLLGLYAQFKLRSTYSRYLHEGVSTGATGAQAAREILDRAGLSGVSVNEVGGHLTDHYDPSKRALFLSSENYHGRSISAVGVAAHEAGHALQHQAAYAPLHLRMALVPITNFASQAVMWITLLGFVMGMMQFVWIAVAAFAVITFFQLVTLPVEFDASRRAKAQLLKWGIIGNNEGRAVGKVLNAAALTYVAAMVQSLAQLLYYVMLARGSDRES